jgi:hypothetical protein
MGVFECASRVLRWRMRPARRGKVQLGALLVWSALVWPSLSVGVARIVVSWRNLRQGARYPEMVVKHDPAVERGE